MATKKKDRKESPIEYLNVARELFAHSLQYLPKLGDKKRTLIQVPLLDYARKIVEYTVFFNREQNDIKRLEYANVVLSYLDIFELQLSVIQELDLSKSDDKQCITDYGWLTFGKLISVERALLRGLHDKISKRLKSQ